MYVPLLHIFSEFFYSSCIRLNLVVSAHNDFRCFGWYKFFRLLCIYVVVCVERVQFVWIKFSVYNSFDVIYLHFVLGKSCKYYICIQKKVNCWKFHLYFQFNVYTYIYFDNQITFFVYKRVMHNYFCPYIIITNKMKRIRIQYAEYFDFPNYCRKNI